MFRLAMEYFYIAVLVLLSIEIRILRLLPTTMNSQSVPRVCKINVRGCEQVNESKAGQMYYIYYTFIFFFFFFNPYSLRSIQIV